MLSPIGPAGIVAGSGATQVFGESAACGVRGAPKVTEPPENKMRMESVKTATNPLRMAITRFMDILPRPGEIANLHVSIILPLSGFRSVVRSKILDNLLRGIVGDRRAIRFSHFVDF